MSDTYWSECLKHTELTSNPSSKMHREGINETETRKIINRSSISTRHRLPITTTATVENVPFRSESGTSIAPSDQPQPQLFHRSANWWIPGGEYTKTIMDYFRRLRG
jgi:hypothetical protein